MDSRQIIDYALDDNAKEMREALYASIHDRITNAFEEKRKEVAGALLGMPLATESVEDESDETIVEAEDKEEGHEDASEDEKMCTSAAKKEVKKHENRMHKED